MKKPPLVYGLRVATILLEQEPERAATVFITDGKSNKDIERLASQNRIRIERTDKKSMDRMCGDDAVHQGIAVALNSWPYAEESDLYELAEEQPDALFLVLDEVQDPHNLGACLRTADAVGASGVIIPKDGSSGLSAVVCKVSCGAAFTVPLFRVGNLSRAIKKMQEVGVWFIGTDERPEQTIYDMDCTGKVGIVMGAEGKGMRKLTKESCDHLVSIPMQGVVESLNVSVTAGICMYEVLRQRINS